MLLPKSSSVEQAISGGITGRSVRSFGKSRTSRSLNQPCRSNSGAAEESVYQEISAWLISASLYLWLLR